MGKRIEKRVGVESMWKAERERERERERREHSVGHYLAHCSPSWLTSVVRSLLLWRITASGMPKQKIIWRFVCGLLKFSACASAPLKDPSSLDLELSVFCRQLLNGHISSVKLEAE